MDRQRVGQPWFGSWQGRDFSLRHPVKIGSGAQPRKQYRA